MRITDLRYKEIINVSNGDRLGFVCDAEIDITCGKLLALIVPGRCRFFGIFGREEDYIIPFDCITRIGEDIILIETRSGYKRGKRGRRSKP